jgi:hypothetical protein
MWQQNGVGAQNDSKRKQQYKEWSNGCEMYDPCPINYKCINKASHLYKRCEGCKVPHGTHNHKARAWAIKRENFAIKVTDETGEEFLKLSKEAEAL